MKAVVNKFLLELNTMTIEKRVEVNASEQAIDYLIEKGFDTKMGARPLARIIDDEIKQPLSRMILLEIYKKAEELKSLSKTINL